MNGILESKNDKNEEKRIAAPQKVDTERWKTDGK